MGVQRAGLRAQLPLSVKATSGGQTALTRSLMGLLTVTTFAAAAGIHYQTPMLGAIAAEFGASPSQIGWIPTANFGGFLFGILFIVPLGDRLDKRRLILVQHCAAMVALLAAAMAPSLVTLALAGFLIGLCGCYAQIIVPVVAELAPSQERGKAVATILTALFSGLLFARITGGFVAEHFDWRWMYVIGAILLAAVTPALLARLPRSEPKTRLSYPALIASVGTLIRNHPDMQRVVLIQTLLGVCYGGFWATIATMLLHSHGLGPASAGLIGIPGAAGILIARRAGRAMDLHGPFPLVVGGTSVMIASYAALALGIWWAAALAIGAALLDCGLRATMVANQTVVNSIAPEARSRSNTVFGMSVWTGNAIGAFIASSALAYSGWLAVCGISVVAAVAALVVQLLARSGRRDRR